MPNVTRTLAIGDIHGCRELLERLLGAMKYDPSTDILAFVGDFIDRGPEPAAVVRLVRQLAAQGQVIAVRGNHEDKCLRWLERVERERTTGKKNAMRPPNHERLRQWEELTADDVVWLKSLPVQAVPAPGWVMVHAGFEDLPRAQQTADHMLRVRWVDQTTGKHMGIDPDSDNPYEKPKGALFWMERWKGPENVVYGHAVHSRKSPRVDRPMPGVETWGIDTGACFGGNLTGLCLETSEVFQVHNGMQYSRLYAALADDS